MSEKAIYNTESVNTISSKKPCGLNSLINLKCEMSQTSNTLILYERYKRVEDRREVLEDKKEKSDPKLNWRDRRFYKLYDDFSMKKESKSDLKNKQEVDSKQQPLKDSLENSISESNKNEGINHNKINNSFSIESIDIHVSQGRISHIQVKVQGDVGYFVNKGPISLTNFRKRKYYALEYVGSNPILSGKYIFLKDILNYIPSGNRYYFPTDKTYRFEYEKDEEPKKGEEKPENKEEKKEDKKGDKKKKGGKVNAVALLAKQRLEDLQRFE